METFSDHSENNNKPSIKRFEKFLDGQEHGYYDIEAFEFFIDHYLEVGNLKKAKKACDLALTYFPFSGEFYMDKTQIELGLENVEEAAEAIENAEIYLPNDAEVLFLKGSVFICQEHYQNGIDCILEAMPELEEKSMAWLQIGMAQIAMNDERAASNSFKEALKNNHANEEALYELSECLDMIGKLEEAVPFFEECVNKDPYSATAWFNLGVIYDKLQLPEDGLKAYDYAITIDESFSSAYFNTGVTLLHKKEFGNALSAFKKTAELEKQAVDDQLHLYLGQCYQNLNDFEKAILHYQQAINQNKKSHMAWYGIGACMDSLERWFESVHFFKQACKLKKKNAVYATALATAEYKVGNYQHAIEAFKKASELDPENFEIWKDWSFIHYENNNIKQAIDIIQQGLEEDPSNASLLYRLVAYQISNSDYKEAFKNLENALILDFEMHTELLEFFSELETQKGLIKVIDQLRK